MKRMKKPKESQSKKTKQRMGEKRRIERKSNEIKNEREDFFH